MAVEVGEKAPDFTLPCCDGEQVGSFQLSRQLGGENLVLVLAFFPLALTPVCTKEMCQFSDDLRQFQQLNAQVYGISVDSPFTLNAFIRAHELKFQMLSDFNKDVSARYGVLHEQLMGLKGISKRSVFVLGRDAVVQYKWVSEDPGVMPDFAEIEAALKGLSG
jgi:peroxiredoxin